MESYAGSTHLRRHLATRRAPSSPVTSSLIYQLDPSNAANYTLNGSGNVTQLNDLSGNGNNFTNANSAVTVVNGGAGFNGNNVLNFNGTANATLSMGNTTTAETVFIIMQAAASQTTGDAGIFGNTGLDKDIRLNNTSNLFVANANGNDFAYQGNAYINGRCASGNPLVTSPTLVEEYASGPGAWLSTSLSNTFYGRYYTGDIGEVLVYNTDLSTSARQEVEAYLMNKWFGVVEPGYAGDNVLPTTTSLAIAAGSSLDLNGGNQELPSVSGDGTVINSSPYSFAVLYPRHDQRSDHRRRHVARRRHARSARLVKQGPATLTLSGVNTYTGGTTLSAGRIVVNNANSLGDASGPLTIGPATLEVAASFASPRNIAMADPAATIQVDPAVTYANGGTLSGTGGLTKTGLGTLVLTGNSTYSGGTTVSAGTLRIGDDTTNGSIAGNIVNNSSVVFSNALAQTYTGTISTVSGPGNFTKTGAGVLSLTAPQTYSGATLVNAGTLKLSPITYPTQGLLGRWTFADGTADDSSGNGYNGTLVGNPTFGPGVGGGECITLNGVNQYVAVNTGGNQSVFDGGTSMTISAWVEGWPSGTWPLREQVRRKRPGLADAEGWQQQSVGLDHPRSKQPCGRGYVEQYQRSQRRQLAHGDHDL